MREQIAERASNPRAVGLGEPVQARDPVSFVPKTDPAPAAISLLGYRLRRQGRFSPQPAFSQSAGVQADMVDSLRRAAPTIGEERLLRLRAIAGTGVWRTADLTVSTVDRGLEIVRTFDSVFQKNPLRPRVSPTDGGGLSVEWEWEGKELFLHIENDGTEEWLLVSGGTERTEVNVDVGALIKWLATSS